MGNRTNTADIEICESFESMKPEKGLTESPSHTEESFHICCESPPLSPSPSLSLSNNLSKDLMARRHVYRVERTKRNCDRKSAFHRVSCRCLALSSQAVASALLLTPLTPRQGRGTLCRGGLLSFTLRVLHTKLYATGFRLRPGLLSFFPLSCVWFHVLCVCKHTPENSWIVLYGRKGALEYSVLARPFFFCCHEKRKHDGFAFI